LLLFVFHPIQLQTASVEAFLSTVGTVQPAEMPFANEISLPFKKEFEGVLFFIGRKEQQAAYVNPHKAGFITVTASSINAQQDISCVVDSIYRGQFWTQNIADSWIQIDLGAKYSVAPTHYTLRGPGGILTLLVWMSTFQAIPPREIGGCKPQLTKQLGKTCPST
jgi:hypothetical protein